ncbi:thiocillin family RiPP [Spiractinospora alimapuensis]|nr:thiocillin family RiPP [Spiractinospora alimapuensis]
MENTELELYSIDEDLSVEALPVAVAPGSSASSASSVSSASCPATSASSLTTSTSFSC